MFENKVKAQRALGDWPLVWKSILGFWGLNVLYVVLRAFVTGDQAKLLEAYRHTPVLVGVGLTLLVWLALRASRPLGLGRRLVVAALVSLPASIGVTAYTIAAIYFFDPELAKTGATRVAPNGTVLRRLPSGELLVRQKGQAKPTVIKLETMRGQFLANAPKILADESVNNFYFFFAWGAFYVAMSTGQRLREAERRAAEFERLAQSAQLRALRYQVNPHFLFNTLNSLSSLIMARRAEEAEAMILSLSKFFRSTLAIDPTEDVTLSEEIALQRLYLDVEKARFPDRLRVDVDIGPGLGKARVPALLLQPIVENAIKYGVAKARNRVVLTIRARVDDGRLSLVVENDGGAATEDDEHHGTGVGLPNVCQRLAARFGDKASCRYGPRTEGGFRVAMIMPLNTDD